jgi:hypothetical protein
MMQLAANMNDSPISPDRGHHRGRPQRAALHPGRRRGPRERGRCHHPGPVRHAGPDQLHGQARPRPDLPGDHRRARPPAAPAADGRRQPQSSMAPPSPSRSRRARASPPASPPRPRPHHRRGRRPDQGRRRHRLAGPRLPAGRPRRRRAGPRRPHRGGRRHQPHGRPDARGRHLRDHEGRRVDGPDARPGRLRPAARPEDRHHRRPDRLPPPHRTQVERVLETPFESAYGGRSGWCIYRNTIEGNEHVVLVQGQDRRRQADPGAHAPSTSPPTCWAMSRRAGTMCRRRSRPSPT